MNMSKTLAHDDSEPARPDTEVVDVLVGNHRAFLSFLEARVGSRALAEDILQDAFAKSLDKLDTLRDNESAVGWFYRVLRNAVIDHHRRSAARSRQLEKLAQEVETEQLPAGEVSNAICKCVADLASTLKPEYREALEQVEVAGLAVKTYAENSGLSSNSAGVRVFRAREALRKQVARSCGTCATHGCLDCTCGVSAH